MSDEARKRPNLPLGPVMTPVGSSKPNARPLHANTSAVYIESKPGSALDRLARKVDGGKEPAIKRPHRASFEDFLEEDARVPMGNGEYGRYSFTGREALRAIVRRIDHVLGSQTGEQIPEARLGIAGGAQWGKTILELNLAAYATSHPFLRVGLFLPDKSLVDGVVDTKLRPDVIDQIPWFAEMTQIGKVLNKSGKQVNRKGAFMVTDGQRSSYGMIIGLNKIPTTLTFDITAQDEVDDIPEKTAKFVRGRRTSSSLRFDIRIGTQRVHGRGQNKVWKDGSQGVVLLGPISDAWQYEPGEEVETAPQGWINPEEAFPGIVRCAVTGIPRSDDPKLTWAGTFLRDGSDQVVATHEHGNVYYLAHPETGEPLDRLRPVWYHRDPSQARKRNWSYRLSQLGVDAISVAQIVHGFCDETEGAISSPEAMTVFRCDVLALPQSTSQALTPAVMDRAQAVDPFDMRLTREDGRPAFGGLDMGDRCWFMTRERESAARRRISYAASIPAGDVVARAVSLFHTIGLTALFIDQRPLVSEARTIALTLNGLAGLTQWPEVPSKGNADAWISLPGGLTWDGNARRWRNLKVAVVRFDKKKIGAGI